MEGYIALHRKIIENELYFSERFTKLQAWIDLLLLATHKKNTLFIRGVEIILKPGELCYSIVSLSKRWRWNQRTVKKFLNSLEKREMIHCRFTNVTTIISIKKWSEYQVFKNETVKKNIKSAEQSAERVQSKVHTINNDNNVNKINTNSEIEKRKKHSVKFAGAMIYSKLVNGINSLPESADDSYIDILIKLKEADNICFRLKYLMLCYALKQVSKKKELKETDFKGYLYNEYKSLSSATFSKSIAFQNNVHTKKYDFKTGLQNSHLD